MDTSADDDRFLICVLRNDDILTPFVTERNQLVTEPIERIFSPDTVYNLRLTLKRMLPRHAPILAAGLIRREDKSIKFTFGEGNSLLKSKLQGEEIPIKENVDVRMTPNTVFSGQYPEFGLDMPEPLWLFLQYSFDHPLKHHQMQRVLENPRGRVRFRDEEGVAREGWIIDLKHEAAANRASFTLRACTSLVGGV